jgi:hypothetical protein
MDYEIIAYLIIIFFVGAMAARWISPILQALGLLQARRGITEKSRDVHEMLFRRRAKAARLHMRGGSLRTLKCLGDRDQYPISVGRIVGIIQGPYITEVFFKPKRFRPTRWALIPCEVHGSVLGRELVVRANGLQPVGNYYEPVYSRNLTSAQVQDLKRLVDEYEALLVTREENVELLEQRVNSWYSAVNTRQTNTRFIARDDHLVRQTTPLDDQNYERETL